MLTTHDREQVLELTRTLHESTPLWAQAVQALDATCRAFLGLPNEHWVKVRRDDLIDILHRYRRQEIATADAAADAIEQLMSVKAREQSPAASAILQLALLDRAAALAMGTFATTQWNFARAAGEIYGKHRAVEGDDDGSHNRGQIPGGEA